VRLRREAAQLYREAIAGCDWLVPQHVPDGWTHDYWTYAVVCDTPGVALRLSDAIVRQGGEQPYPAWRLTYDEPAFQPLFKQYKLCPVAESLQPRLLQFQTNSIASAEKNAKALKRAIEELS
jgi:dTDP-4-amino-4,6-dideoxygalactose transaminase